jgi:pimeloyl-ACP methyl ester carboxylesterase
MTGARPGKRQVLFIHGGGDGGYEADAELAASLQRSLGTGYEVRYPRMPEEPPPDFGWGHKIGSEIAAIEGEALLVGHSLGASMLLKYLSENRIASPIRGIFLIATPWWSGDEEWKQGLQLREDFADAIPRGWRSFFTMPRMTKKSTFRISPSTRRSFLRRRYARRRVAVISSAMI